MALVVAVSVMTLSRGAAVSAMTLSRGAVVSATPKVVEAKAAWVRLVLPCSLEGPQPARRRRGVLVQAVHSQQEQPVRAPQEPV